MKHYKTLKGGSMKTMTIYMVLALLMCGAGVLGAEGERVLLLVLHGQGGSPEQMQVGAGISSEADRRGWRVVYMSLIHISEPTRPY